MKLCKTKCFLLEQVLCFMWLAPIIHVMMTGLPALLSLYQNTAAQWQDCYRQDRHALGVCLNTEHLVKAYIVLCTFNMWASS